MVDRTKEQEREIERRRILAAEQRTRERELKQQLELREERRMEAEESFSSKQQERDIVSRKLKKLYAQFQEAKLEIDDLQAEFAREREELSQTFADLQKELKLRQTIIEHFVPAEEVRAIKVRAVFDEANSDWRLRPLAHTASAESGGYLREGEEVDSDGEGCEGRTYRPMMIKRPVSAVPGARHAVAAEARARAAVDRNPRFRPENILLVDLDMPDRTTQEYVGPSVDPAMQQVLDDALRDDEEMTLDAAPTDFLDRGMSKAKEARRKQKARAGRGDDPAGASGATSLAAAPDPRAKPQSRGLVKRGARYA